MNTINYECLGTDRGTSSELRTEARTFSACLDLPTFAYHTARMSFVSTISNGAFWSDLVMSMRVRLFSRA
jgi:hypothetical protein